MSEGEAPASATALEPLVVTVSVNGRFPDTDAIVYRRGPQIWLLPEALLSSLGVLADPGEPTQQMEGAVYRTLQVSQTVHIRYDQTLQQLSIDLPAERFRRYRLSAQDTVRGPGLEDSVGALWLDYHLAAEDGTTGHSAVEDLTLGLSRGPAVVKSAWTLTDSPASDRSIRRGTALTWDNIAQRTTWTFGDCLGAGLLGQLPVSWGGVLWSRNFDLDPGFAPFPLPTLQGRMSQPGEALMLVDGRPVFRAPLTEGQFVVDNVQAVAGAGAVEWVTRDLSGRETRILQPIYLDTSLLKPGLSSFGLGFGAEQHQGPQGQMEYGGLVARAALREGLTDRLTVGGALERDPQAADAFVGAGVLLGHFASVSWSTGASRTPAGRSGVASSLGVGRQSERVSFNLSASWASASFAQVGASPQPGYQVRTTYQATLGTRLFGGSLALGVSVLNKQQGTPTDLLTWSYSWPLRFANLSIGGLHDPHDARLGQVSAQVSVVLGSRANLSSGLVLTRQEPVRAQVALTQSPPFGGGVGYAAALESGPQAEDSASVTWRRPAWEGELALERPGTGTAVQATLQGGLILTTRGLFAARRPADGLILVDVGSAGAVPVQVNHQDFGQTNSEGLRMVPAPGFVPVSVTVDDSALPLEVRLEETTRQVLTGTGRVGRAQFPVLSPHTWAATLRYADGTVPKVGTPLESQGTPAPLPVGYEGAVFLESQTPMRTYRIHTAEHHCSFEVQFTHSAPDASTTAPPSIMCK